MRSISPLAIRKLAVGGVSDRHHASGSWDNTNSQARAYVAATRARDAAKDIALILARGAGQGGFSDGTRSGSWISRARSSFAVPTWPLPGRGMPPRTSPLVREPGLAGFQTASRSGLWKVARCNQARALRGRYQGAGSAKDIALGSGSWQGGFSDGITLWFLNFHGR